MKHTGFAGSYLDRTRAALEAIDLDDVGLCCEALLRCALRDGTVFIAGNGGSAALADHLACDLVKGVLGRSYPVRSGLRPRVHSLAANSALVTAWANDVDYAVAFAEGLRSLARSGDLLLVISASGRSKNVIAALQAADELGLEKLGWLGFDGEPARALCDSSVLVPVFDYGIVESAHAALGHLVTDWLREQLIEAPAAESRSLPRAIALQ